MGMHWHYAKYVFRHKWFVFLVGRKLGVGWWQLITHDWSKFLPSEWLPYARFFYGGPHLEWSEITTYEKMWYPDSAWRRSKAGVEEAFNRAWLLHIHRQPHHWQHWVLNLDDGGMKVLEMPAHFIYEMIADWMGAGQAQGRDDLPDWYLQRRETMLLGRQTRHLVERLLGVPTKVKP